jgi:hypothetical protein
VLQASVSGTLTVEVPVVQCSFLRGRPGRTRQFAGRATLRLFAPQATVLEDPLHHLGLARALDKRLETKGRLLELWKANDPQAVARYNQNHLLKQPPIPLTPVFRYQPKEVRGKSLDTLSEISLVPYGITKLRISCFPFFLWWL